MTVKTKPIKMRKVVTWWWSLKTRLSVVTLSLENHLTTLFRMGSWSLRLGPTMLVWGRDFTEPAD